MLRVPPAQLMEDPLWLVEGKIGNIWSASEQLRNTWEIGIQSGPGHPESRDLWVGFFFFFNVQDV